MTMRTLRPILAAALPVVLLAACARKEKATEGKELSKNPLTAISQISEAAKNAELNRATCGTRS